MQVKLIFDVPDELAEAKLEPQDILRMYAERMFNIRIAGMEIPKPYNLAANENDDYMSDFRKKPSIPVMSEALAKELQEVTEALSK